MVCLSSYLSDYFDTINKINQHYRTNKPIKNLDYLFNKAEFLRSSCIETKQALYNIYSDIDNIDDDCIMDGMPHGRLILHGDKVQFMCKDNCADELICEISMPKSVSDLTFSDMSGKIQEEVTVVAFIQRVNTLINREHEYIQNRKGYLHERYSEKSKRYNATETDEIQCICIH